MIIHLSFKEFELWKLLLDTNNHSLNI